MSFLNKMKGFLNVDGLKVEITKVENPFPLYDSVMKGNYVLTTKTECEVLRTVCEFIVQKKHADGRIEDVVLARDDSKEVHNVDLSYPFTLKAGEAKDLGFCIVGAYIPSTLSRLGFGHADMALESPDVKFFVRVMADVKGSPFDPEARVDVKVVA